jgi:tetratricopeptide (TPR) repeat protein
MSPKPSPIRSISLLFLTAITLVSSAAAQSIDHAKQLFDGAQYAEARSELRALQKADDRNAATAYYLGRIAAFDNDYDEAIRQLERAVKLEEGNALYHVWLGSAIAEAAGRASKFKQPFMARRVKKEWERAVQLDPNQIEARVDLVQFYTMAPGFMGGSIEKAREQAGEITKRNAVRGALARGMIAEHEKNAVAEEAAYQEAIIAGPDSAAGYFALSHAFARDGKAAESFAAIDQYVKRHPDDRWALYHTGRAAGTTGQQLDRGEAALQQFLGAPPSDAHATTIAGAHYWLGQIAEKRGAKDLAREQYRTALRINPNAQQPQRALEALK